MPSCHLHTALPWFTDLGSKAADTLLSTRNPHTVNKSALEEAAQKVTTFLNHSSLLPTYSTQGECRYMGVEEDSATC